jgi:two-component system response regulator AtoC
MLEILLVSDEANVQVAAGATLRAAGHRVTETTNEPNAMKVLGSHAFDVVIASVNLERGGARAIFRHLHATSPGTDVILMSDYGATPAPGVLAEEPKPLDLELMGLRLERISESRRLADELASARMSAEHAPNISIVGRTPSMVQLRARLATMAVSEANVLIAGEVGTGKELVARALHERSPRAAKPFVAVNCAAFSGTLLDAELFGAPFDALHGAATRRVARFEAARGGTLFIDEVAEMPALVQVKVLRVLRDGPVDVRVICATHRDLEERVAQGSFLAELHGRLRALEIVVPALRDRRGDLPLLVDHLLRRARPGMTHAALSSRAWAALGQYAFPGNVLELEHALEHAVVLAGGTEILVAHLPPEIAAATPGPSSAAAPRSLAQAAHEFEREYLLRALALAKGKKGRAAELLGISRKNLWEKRRAHGLTDPEHPE